MTREEKLQELYKMLHEGGFPRFVTDAIQGVVLSGEYSEVFVDTLYNNVKKELTLFE
mgnify:CR=1 FL=1